MLLAQDIRPLEQSSPQRLAIIGAVIGIHVAVIAAFLSGLRPSSFLADPPGPIVIKFIPNHNQPPPPPPHTQIIDTFQRLIPIDPQAPRFDTDNSNNTIHDQGPVASNPPANSSVFIGAQAIAGTHTTPDYPPLDTRLGHEGNVLLKLAIDERGAVVDAQVEHSSGYDSLDRAAANWVKSHWRYHPATRAGDAVPSSAEVTVTFRLTTRQ